MDELCGRLVQGEERQTLSKVLESKLSRRVHLQNISSLSPEVSSGSDGVSRLGLGLETRFLESRSRKSCLGLEAFRSRALGLETLHEFFFFELLQEGAP